MYVYVTLQSYQLQGMHPSTHKYVIVSLLALHLGMDTIPNPYSTFMCKHANMCKYVQI